MQIRVDDLDDIRELAEAQEELRLLKERELELRKRVATAVMGKKTIMPGSKTVTLGDTKVTVTYNEKLQIMDADSLADYVDDDDLPEDTVTLKPHTTLGKMKKVDDDHPIWDCVYVDVSPTPTVKIEHVG